MYDIVDSQYHLFQTMDETRCLAVMDALGVQSVLIDEAWHQKALDAPRPNIPLGEAGIRPLALGGPLAAMQHPHRFRYLLRVNHRDPELATVMRIAVQDEHCLAFRTFCFPKDLVDLRDGRFAPLFRTAATLGRPVFIQTLGQSSLLAASFESVPDCRIVIDHVGLVKTTADWEALLRLAGYPNVALKWCHAGLAFPSDGFPFAPMQAALRQAVDAFGQERVLWASDATMLRPEMSWADTLYYVRECNLLTIDERAWVLGRAARTLLDWPAPEPKPRINPLLPT